MKIFTLLLASLAVTSATISSSCADTEYEAVNDAVGTSGGLRFQKEIGLDYAISVLETSSCSFFDVFGQQSVANQKKVTFILFVLQQTTGIVSNINGQANSSIVMNADYVAGFVGDVKEEFTGIMYHEMARARQWDGAGSAPFWLLTGVADFFRLKGGYASPSWVQPGQGGLYTEGYDVAARFLEFWDAVIGGRLVSELNALMREEYSDGFFVQCTGKTVDELWNAYKLHYSH